MDDLYRACKSSTYKLKDDYDVITKKTKVVGVLHELYYNSLAEKKNYEEDRDDFFKVFYFNCLLKVALSYLPFVSNSQKQNLKYLFCLLTLDIKTSMKI